MKLLNRLFVIVALTVGVLKLYMAANMTMALVVGAIGFAGVIVWIGET